MFSNRRVCMNKKYLKLFFFIITPILLLLPLSLTWNFTKYFKNIILEPKKTGITTLNFYDDSRSRPIVTEIWYPVEKNAPAKTAHGFWVRCDEARDVPMSAQKSKYPLIILSHGSGGHRFDVSWLAEILSANGYIVAAMDHYGNTWNNKIPEYYTRPWERPKDVSFVIDQLLSSSHFKDRIDEDRIGFAGYSLGGATGIWVAGAVASSITDEQIKEACQKDLEDTIPNEIIQMTNYDDARQSFADKRVSAFLLMAPALGWLFDEKSLSNIESPALIVAAEKDKITPIESNAKLFAKKMSKATLRIVPGDADHYVFLNRASQLGKRLLEPRFSEDHSTLGRRKIHEDIGKNAIEFFDSHL
jgi:predicted dienelactone hydrolase